ncbi:MAG: hypothetical protein U0Q16_31105 [Bryobacteraceae bacterium]
MRDPRPQLREWLAETHGTDFELLRHFFLRFFDSDLVTTPGQWRVVAIGALAIMASLGLLFTQAFYHKYLELNALDEANPIQRALLADGLFLISLSMASTGLLTALQWPSLFPGLRDYLALAALPIRPRQIFTAKFAALMTFVGAFVFAANALPALVLPGVMQGHHLPYTGKYIPAIFVSGAAAGLFVFFVLVALQGVLLNILPIRWFQRVSLYAQGLLLTALLCSLPFVFSVSSLTRFMTMRPAHGAWIPPVWFLGIEQVLSGNREPYAWEMASIAACALALSIASAVAAYAWSYRWHRVRVLESPTEAQQSGDAMNRWKSLLADRWTDTRELAVFSFISKTLARSRQHRMVLTAFAAIAIAIVFQGFVSMALSRQFRGFDLRTFALREVVISAPLALSLFVLAGYRYLFRLPVELRANWIFRFHRGGNRSSSLRASDRFLWWYAVAPVALLTFPVLALFLDWGSAVVVAILALLSSLLLRELVLLQFQQIPFTSSYLPGRRPLIETVLIYGVAVAIYVSALSTVIARCLDNPPWAVVLFGVMLALWARLRKARMEELEVGELDFEELEEPALHHLGLDGD